MTRPAASATPRHLATVIAIKAALGAIVLLGGFRAVSDDDFARVVHAQEFALAPRIDPTGTSWLPFPFWLTGGVMHLAGTTSLTLARVVAFALGLASAALLYAAARLLVPDPRSALLGSIIAAIFPWSAVLGVATVPELPTAALSVFAIASLTRPSGSLRVLGALALLAATLSRYEPWLIAAAFAAFTTRDAIRSREQRLLHLAAIAVALLGPALWILHNAHAHGDALHFLARVSAYKRAVRGETSPLSILTGYPLSLLREEPELCTLALLFLIAARRLAIPLPPSILRPAITLGATLLLLSLASLPGGAPTHHAGRALLAIWLTIALYLGPPIRAALGSEHRKRFTLFVAFLMPFGAFFLRPWFARLDSFITRNAEITLGRTLATLAPAERVLLETEDYAFFAIQAGHGTPHLLIPDRRDPLAATPPSSFTSLEALRARAADATIIVAHPSPITAELGPPIAAAGPWSAYRLR